MPAVPGDLIIGDHFYWDIDVHDVDAADEMILVQYEIHWDPAWLDLVWLWEGTFMNDAAWAPYGTFNNITIKPVPGEAASFILILPNETTGEWDWGVFPSGDGLIATAEFVVIDQPPEPADPTFPVTLPGVFTEYFVDKDAEYIPAGPAHNGTYTLTGFYWNYPVALKTFTPAMPLVDEIVKFDASASYDPDAWDHIVSYLWDFGDGNITLGDAIMYHQYPVMGDYIVHLTVTDTMGKNDTETEIVTVIFGRLIDVYVCYPDPFGGQGLNKTADMFWPQKTVCVKVNVTYNGNPVQFKPVAFQIKSPNGVYDFCETNVTDENGYCWIDFGLPWPCGDWNDTFGIWTIVAKVDIRCVVVEDWLWFKVWWLAETIEVTPKEAEYYFCQYAEFFINIRTYATQPRWMLVTLAVFDDLDVCIGTDYTWILIGEEHTWCTWVYYNTTLSVHVPKWAFVGKGIARVNIFWPDWPEFCGSPMCPEATAEFKLVIA
jgi:PKD repeat protein